MKVKTNKTQIDEELEEKVSDVTESEDSNEEDDEMPELNDPVEANDKILGTMDSSDDDSDEAPEEISSKPKEPPVEVFHIDAKGKPVKPAQQKSYDKEDEKKTVFCGNVPNVPNVNETRIKDMFSQYGPVKSVRFRSESGRVIFSKKHKKECTSFIAYIVFKNEEDARKSLELNGHQILDNHLRVNMANNKNETFSTKGTIFVGNLPFDASEAEVHEYFSNVGKIEYVRMIAKKGIGYVCFQKGVNIATVLKLNNKHFKGRNLRISRCESKDKQEKKKLFKKDPKTGRISAQKTRQPHKINDDKFLNGRNNNNPIIKKIKDTHKAKFNKFREADQPSKKELFRPGGQRDRERREQFREHTNKKQKFSGSKINGVENKSKKTKKSKGAKDQKVIIKKLKSAASRGLVKS